MSPRAAWRLETLGFTQVHDYVAGKLDWLASGGEVVRPEGSPPTAGELARRDVPACGLLDDVETVAARVAETNWTICAVLNAEGVVLGLLGRSGLTSSGRAGESMREGPSTIRPDQTRDAVAARMKKHDLSVQLVTTSDGRLVGAVRREDVG
jgi:predicted transcriptional regulator